MARLKMKTLDEANAKVLAEIVSAEETSDFTRVHILNKLMEAKEHQSFFQTIFEENLSWGSCPNCGHTNHWSIPEDFLNQLGYVSHKVDSRVLATTNIKTCPTFQEACGKKKVTM